LRATHDALMAAKDAEIARLDARVASLEAAHDAYVAGLAAMTTRQVEARTPPTPVAKREPDEVDTAIDWKAQGNVMVKRHLERYAKGERRKGREAKDIADDIMQGDRVGDDEPVE